MLREIERIKAYIDYVNSLDDSYKSMAEISVMKAFDEGAKWADKTLLGWIEENYPKYLNNNEFSMERFLKDLKNLIKY
jgi:hypothetical protein